MNKILLIILALLVYEVSAVKFEWPTIYSRFQVRPASRLADPTANEILNACKIKKHCITAFVAPWCPVCKSSVSSLRLIDDYLLKYRKDVGLNIVVGAAAPDSNDKEVSQLQPLKAVADNTGEIMKSEHIQAFPTWIVRDKMGHEIFRKAGGIQIAQQSEVEMLLREFIPER